MAYYPTQTDIRLLHFNEKSIHVKIVLLNESYKIISEMRGQFISGSISMDVDSDIRNTLTISLAITSESFNIGEDKQLWINQFVRVYIGYSAPIINDIMWYDKGIFVITDYNITQSISSTRVININFSDLVCKLNGDVGGSLEGLETIIYQKDEHTIRDAIIETLTDLSEFTKYYVEDMPKLIPYDLEFGATDTVWDILTKLRDLYPGYEMFFDIDGTFVCKKIATKDTDPVVLDDSILKKIIISESDNGELKDIRNTSKVWGKCLDTDYFTEDVTYDANQNTYTCKFTGVAVNEDGSLPTSTKFACKIPTTNTKDAPKLAIQNDDKLVVTLPITDSLEENIKKDFFIADASFVFRYRRNSMYVLGQWQIFAVNKLRNTSPTEEEKKQDKEKHGCDDITYTIIPDSPFAIERIGERLKTYAGGEYDDIQAIDDCITRAEYETWKSAKVVYTTSLESIYIPWIQGNEKIIYTLKSDNITRDWVIVGLETSISSGIMTMDIVEFEPLYNFEVEE